jgi:hypothetical protein
MARFMLRRLICTAFLVTAISLTGLVRAEIPSTIMRVSDEIEFDSVGNLSGTSEISMSPDLYKRLITLLSPTYTETENGQQVVKTKPPQVDSVLRFIGLTSTPHEIRDVKGNFDDEAALIYGSYRILGRVRFKEGRWRFAFTNDPDPKLTVSKSDIGTDSALLEFRHQNGGISFITRLKIKLPAGSTNVEFLKDSLELVYAAPPPPAKTENLRPKPDFKLIAKPQIMSALYKQYANPKWLELWTARSTFQNDTADTLTDFRVRYRLANYSGWSPWSRTDTVYPSQIVSDVFYPVIDNKISELKGATPAQVEVEYEYLKPNGDKVTESDAQSVKILGMNEALWSSLEISPESTWYEVFRNGPMVLSTFTSAVDPVINDVVGMVSQATGGAGASIDDESALKFLGTLYNLFRENIAYETTPGELQPDGLLHQHLKYGRDVLRSRSGTCVNLSILYASACEAAGLDPFIVVVPGHAFAGVKLPKSGLPVFIETTGCGGGTKETSMTFTQARESAYKTYLKWTEAGLIQEADIRTMRRDGVTPPELPATTDNPLKEWGIKQPEVVDNVSLPKLLVAVKTALEAVGLRYTSFADRPVIGMSFSTKEGNEWNTYAFSFEDVEIVVFESQIPGKVPADQHDEVSKLLADMNPDQLHGHFALFKDGTISFRTSTDVRGGTLSNRMVQSEVDIHFNLMQKHVPELRKYAIVDQNPQTDKTEPQPMPDDTPDPVPQDTILIGQWKTIFRDQTGSFRAQGVELRKDGTFMLYVANVNGGGQKIEGTWTLEDNVLTTVSTSGQTSSGKITIVNANEVIFHDENLNQNLIYQRITD